MTAHQPIRASDHDRDVVTRLLGEQAGVGRLTLAELDERTERALTARTRNELTELIADLPVAADFDGEPHGENRATSRLPWCLVCLLPLALGLSAVGGGPAAAIATLIGLVTVAVLYSLTQRRGTSR